MITQKLEVINLQLARKKETRRKVIRGSFVALALLVSLIAAVLFVQGSPYLNWDYSDPETAVLGAAFHSFEWLFVRVAPLLLITAGAGIYLSRKRTG